MDRQGESRANVLGTGITPLNMEGALQTAISCLEEGRRGYVCVTGVHGVIEARKDPAFRNILNRSLFTIPDGMPTVWVGKLQGFQQMQRVPGPEFMAKMCDISRRKGYSHFLYGGTQETLRRLERTLANRFPGINIAGGYAPPFRPLNMAEEKDLASLVHTAAPDILWVGISTPKQERFMARHSGELNARVMVGVGAAFNYLLGDIKYGPELMRSSGLEWAYRLAQEPRRLWRRYLYNNPRFLFEITLQLAGLRQYPLE